MLKNDKGRTETVYITYPWVNILPRNPYLAIPGVLKFLILLTGKTGNFQENLPNP